MKCTKQWKLQRRGHARPLRVGCLTAGRDTLGPPGLADGQAGRVLLEPCPQPPSRSVLPPASPGSSFVFSSLSFPGVGLVSAPDPVQYLSPGYAICSHSHLFNIHISCLLLCPTADTGPCSLRPGTRATVRPSFSRFALSSPGEDRGLQPGAERLMPPAPSRLRPHPALTHTRAGRPRLVRKATELSPVALLIPSSGLFFLLAT